jgi:hypothetical protein
MANYEDNEAFKDHEMNVLKNLKSKMKRLTIVKVIEINILVI